MKKLKALLKVSFNHDMNIFKINSKKKSIFSTIVLPTFLTIYIMMVLALYSWKLINMLESENLPFIALTFFAFSITIITLLEGIYKSSSILFNCKDDNILLSLPIKRRTVLLIRLCKFYAFEVLYNSLFILPAMIIYAVKLNPEWTYYLVSLLALLILPIVPIILSCLIGFIVTFISSKLKNKNIIQTVISTLFLLGLLYLSFNMDNFVMNIMGKASSINDVIIKLYYPVGAYISLITDFNIITLLIYIASHMLLLVVTILILGLFYFKINSSFKGVLLTRQNKNYKIRRRSKILAFVKKELNRFLTTPVFITNAGFGLVLFIIACVFCCVKFDLVIANFSKMETDINIDTIRKILPVIMLGMISFVSFMTSITSSMISLEGKTFNILKSLPIKPLEIVLYKVITALVIMLPCILIGDIIIFIKFNFDVISIILIIIASLLLPLISELIGIIVNLRYPKIDAVNDTEIVKQSMSSLIATFIGMGLVGLTVIILYELVKKTLETYIIMLVVLGIYSLACVALMLILRKVCDKWFNAINS